MKPYTFYIRHGKAIQHPVGGGTIERVPGQRNVDAVNVSGQGNKVIVTYEDGSVTEHPWPGTGGHIGMIVPPQSGWRKRSTASWSSSSGSATETSGNSGCSTVFGWLVVICLAVMAFHAPYGYFVWKRLGISPGEATYASVRCAEGWIGSALIWVSLAGLVYGLIELGRKKGAKTFYGAAILAGFSTWFVWDHMETIRDSYNAIKAEEIAEAAKKTTNTGDSTQSQTKPSESVTPSKPPVNVENQVIQVKEGATSWMKPETPRGAVSPLKMARVWTDSNGLKIDGALVRIENEIAYFKMSGSEKELGIPLRQLAEEDQVIAKALDVPQAKKIVRPSDFIEIESTDGRGIRAKILSQSSHRISG